MRRVVLQPGPLRAEARNPTGLTEGEGALDSDDGERVEEDGDEADGDEEDEEDEEDGDDDDPREVFAEDSQAPNLVPEDKAHNVLAGRIELLEQIGQGGMGAVWRGYHLKLGRLVAVKILDEALQLRADGRERFIREAGALALLDHPGVVRVYDCDEIGGRLFLCMELLEGETLLAVMERGRFDALEVIDLGRQICDAMEAAHVRGILHRDLSPSNIMRSRDGRSVKIIDWGLCKYLDLFYVRTPPRYAAPPGSRLVTPLGARFGTPEYMAPEMIVREDPGPPSFRTDVYALGVLLYELLTARHPFAPGERRTPRPVSDAVPGFEDVELEAALQEAVRFDPDARTQTMAAFRQALERARESLVARRAVSQDSAVEGRDQAAARGSATGSVGAGPPTPPSAPSRLRSAALLVAGAVLGTLGTLAVVHREILTSDGVGDVLTKSEPDATSAAEVVRRAARCEAAGTAPAGAAPAPAAPADATPTVQVLATNAPRARARVREETFAQVMQRLTPGIRACSRGSGITGMPITVQVRYKSGGVDAVRVRRWSQEHAISTCIESVIRKAKPPPSESPVAEFTFFAEDPPRGER